ncbi:MULTISPECIES: glycoside hydrolase family 32 protein [Saccharibacillus]|uniref:glycoside hydrolase family 32 protein n=1 Tax=Saccharibacillus TaxID=456492 RepID=UPI00123BFEC5|nr:sucrose-6-phosphate hydrolase [Saccharibacillus sp. WB 17]MWJ31027.1 sucrose-6-phosphate hydrolase [Saccharibacillus sp. WB 17]
MHMTRAQKYRLLRQAEAGELERLAERAADCAWRQTYHIQPHAGLLNDPNGFAYYNGQYHLFYQWFPLGTEHGMKYWYHVVSSDLARWTDAGIGLEPGGLYDSHGAYSGSAIEKDGRLYLMYTGNTRDADWVRRPYQCLAVMDEDGTIAKTELPVIADVPAGYTDHFRDPKVWREGDAYLCVIGAQRSDLTGAAVLYRSPDLLDWNFAGEIRTSLPNFGYMWECPDYFELDGTGVLLLCPQGVERDGERFRNIYQSGYLLGEPLNTADGTFRHGAFAELDRGFDFYAPQTTAGPDGQRLLVGWMGLPDLDYPTDDLGWAHCLTLPRELSLRGGRLIQRPAAGLRLLRGEERSFSAAWADGRRSFDGIEGRSYELQVRIAPAAQRSDLADGGAEDGESSANRSTDRELPGIGDGRFGVEFRTGAEERTVLTYDAGSGTVTLDRSRSGVPLGIDYEATRSWTLDAAVGRQDVEFRLFVDTSSVEIFVNDGEEVFTARLFPDSASTGIAFFADGGGAAFEGSYWPYGEGAIPRGLPAGLADYGQVRP